MARSKESFTAEQAAKASEARSHVNGAIAQLPAGPTQQALTKIAERLDRMISRANKAQAAVDAKRTALVDRRATLEAELAKLGPVEPVAEKGKEAA